MACVVGMFVCDIAVIAICIADSRDIRRQKCGVKLSRDSSKGEPCEAEYRYRDYKLPDAAQAPGKFQIDTGALHMVVNRVRKKMLRTLHATIDDAIDTAGLPLLGVIPEDETMPLYAGRGIPLLLSDNQYAAQAYRNIARRMTGQRAPLLRIR